MLETFFALFKVIYVLIFFIAVYIYLRFEWGSEGQDERGRIIANKSFGVVFPLLLIGWLAIELINDYVTPFSYETYKLLIWFLVTGLIIIHAINLTILKRRH